MFLLDVVKHVCPLRNPVTAVCWVIHLVVSRERPSKLSTYEQAHSDPSAFVVTVPQASEDAAAALAPPPEVATTWSGAS